MHPMIAKSFGGLSAQYYIRHLLFGMIFPGIILFALSHSQTHDSTIKLLPVAMLIVNTVLYPYSRFVYESVIGFLVGQNVFLVNAILMFAVKLVSMLLCWVLAAFIAPIGLLYLYYHHTNN